MIYFRRKIFNMAPSPQQQGPEQKPMTSRDLGLEQQKLQRQLMMTQRMKYRLAEQEKTEKQRRTQESQKAAQREKEQEDNNVMQAKKIQAEEDMHLNHAMNQAVNSSKAKTVAPVSMKQ